MKKLAFTVFALACLYLVGTVKPEKDATVGACLQAILTEIFNITCFAGGSFFALVHTIGSHITRTNTASAARNTALVLEFAIGKAALMVRTVLHDPIKLALLFAKGGAIIQAFLLHSFNAVWLAFKLTSGAARSAVATIAILANTAAAVMGEDAGTITKTVACLALFAIMFQMVSTLFSILEWAVWILTGASQCLTWALHALTVLPGMAPDRGGV